MRRRLVMLFMLGMCSLAFADSPPPWFAFKVQSENKLFVAQVGVADKQGQPHPWDWTYRLQVATVARPAVRWVADYAYDGYPGGILSNDGDYFAYVNVWYFQDSPVLTVYYAAGKRAFTGTQLGISPKGLQNTASHQLWLDGESRFTPARGTPAMLVVKTVQGPRCVRLKPVPSIELKCPGA